MIKCKKCNVDKELNAFSKDKARKNGLCSKCKECYSKYRKMKREHISRVNKKYKEKNKEHLYEVSKKYREDNKEKISEQRKEYRKNNREKILEINRKYRKRKIESDALYKLRIDTTRAIYNSLKKGNYKKTNRTSEILGCSYNELIEHLNNNTYGFEYMCGELDIDHIIPLSSAETEEELLELNHYTNLQLLPSEYNRHIKRDNTFDIKDFENWLLCNV